MDASSETQNTFPTTLNESVKGDEHKDSVLDKKILCPSCCTNCTKWHLGSLFVWNPFLIYQVSLQNKKIHTKMSTSLAAVHAWQWHPHIFHGKGQTVDYRVCWNYPNHYTDPNRPGNWDKVLWKGKFILIPVRHLTKSGHPVCHPVWDKRGWKWKKWKKKLLLLANRKMKRGKKKIQILRAAIWPGIKSAIVCQ